MSDSVKTSLKTADANADECTQLLDKTLDALEKLKTAKAEVDGELATNKSLRAREEAYNQALLKTVALLVSAEKRDKTFFKKLLEHLKETLEKATNPENLASIATLIIFIKNLK